MKLKNKLLLGSLTAVLLAVMSFSAWKIWVIRSEYHAGEAAYEDISHMISLPQKAAVPQPPATSESGGAETASSASISSNITAILVLSGA